MFLVDITYPDGALDEEVRSTMAKRIAVDLLGGPGDDGPEATMERARAMTHVWFRPAQSWTTGHGSTSQGAAIPYSVTVTVPHAWRRDISGHAIESIRNVLLDHDAPGTPERQTGDLWVNVVGVRDGSIGLDGHAYSADDVVMRMTEAHRADPQPVDLPDGVVVDPICGMHVDLDADDAVTLRHDGETLGFCSAGCRSAFRHSA